MDQDKEEIRPSKSHSSEVLKSKKDYKWVATIVLSTFSMSVVLSFGIERVSENVNFIVLILVLLLLIFISIISDIVGIAVTAADEPPFHAMASKKIKGAKEAIFLIENADRVSNICNDVVGDMVGIISGSLGSAIAVITAVKLNFTSDALLLTVIIAIISSLTVGGKAIGKGIALKYCNNIMFFTGKVVAFFKFKKK
jgi:CBS domain containing-hemolysin-like protein